MGGSIAFQISRSLPAFVKQTKAGSDVTDLKSNLLVLTEKMATVEATGKLRDRALHRLETVAGSHATHFIEMNRNSEDLDNRGRRSNIRVRGIQETMDPDQIIPTLQRVFNILLERQEDTDIEFVRAHWALRARGPDTAPPRDIICCLQSYPGGHHEKGPQK